MSSEYRPEGPSMLNIADAMKRAVRCPYRPVYELAQIIHAHYEKVGAPGRIHAQPEADQDARHVLLVGPRGSGKSRLVREAARCVGAPLVVVDAAHLVADVLSGRGVDDWAGRILVAAADDRPTAERAIIMIQDMDCLRDGFNADGREITGAEAQRIVADIIADRSIAIPHPLGWNERIQTSTRALLFVCLGELPDVAFAPGARGSDSVVRAHPYDQLEAHDILPELARHFAYTVVVDRPDAWALRFALTAPESGIIPRYQRLFAAHGIDLVFTEEAVETAVELARVDGRGEYAVSALVRRCVDGLEFQLPELARAGVSHVVVTEETVHLGLPPQLDGELPPPPPTGPFAPVPEDLSAQIEELERELNVQRANDIVQAWWGAFRTVQRSHPEVVLRAGQRLRRRGFGIADAYRAVRATETTNIDCIMLYLDYLRAWKQIMGPKSFREHRRSWVSPHEFPPTGQVPTIAEEVLDILRDHFGVSAGALTEDSSLEGRFALSDAGWREIHQDIVRVFRVPGLPCFDPVVRVRDLTRLVTIAVNARNRR